MEIISSAELINLLLVLAAAAAGAGFMAGLLGVGGGIGYGPCSLLCVYCFRFRYSYKNALVSWNISCNNNSNLNYFNNDP